MDGIIKAIPNAFANLVIGLLDIWNSGVSTYKSLERGTYLKDLGGEFKQIGTDIKDYSVNTYNFMTRPQQKRLSVMLGMH
jgi:hypothetical protein